MSENYWSFGMVTPSLNNTNKNVDEWKLLIIWNGDIINKPYWWRFWWGITFFSLLYERLDTKSICLLSNILGRRQYSTLQYSTVRCSIFSCFFPREWAFSPLTLHILLINCYTPTNGAAYIMKKWCITIFNSIFSHLVRHLLIYMNYQTAC